MNRILLGLCALLLAACTTPPKVEYVDRVKEVPVPVKKPCLSTEQVTAPPQLLLDTADFSGAFGRSEVIRAARADRIVMKQYIKETQAIMINCSK